LDLNNVYVAAHNHEFDSHAYLEGIPRHIVQEFHLAGFSRIAQGGHELLIDTHGTPVCDAVWDLYRVALRRFGNVPTLIEWDADLPNFDVLQTEARKADSLRSALHALAA
jgi:uncharacterized protein